ncbi:phage holin, lambda family [Azotobacter beijerinckii]|uniref:Phage holin, lambda family n=1 Tax=Azotobacter beijerinckii TaxID=170623 RepID=A0A1I0Z4N6_9GAMM|nr:phage holin, lambda family [Azotobacter beijerinckii]SFB19408.1 phage holin, lambda family [Azotobacter beijerinckii]
MQMPEKNPSAWADLLTLLIQFAPNLYAPALSVVIAGLRVLYGGGTWRQVWLEGALCGAATLAIKPLLIWLGMPADLAVFIGACFGFVGVEKLRERADQVLGRKAEGQ